MIIDSHLHVWRSAPDFPDQTATTVSPASDVPLEVLNEYMQEYGVDRAVIVQPVYPGEDNSYVAECAASNPDRFAAVCVVDPRKADAADRLEYWVDERGCKGLRLRPRVPDETACFGDESTFALWERAQALGVVINVLGNAEHLATMSKLAERFSDTDIILDHIGHPNVATGVQSELIQSLLDLARHPRIHIKISGYNYYSQQPYPYVDCHELVEALYDRFGAARLIWGSDFPHVLLKAGYGRTLKLPERALTFLSHSDREQIMGGNASRLYWP